MGLNGDGCLVLDRCFFVMGGGLRFGFSFIGMEWDGMVLAGSVVDDSGSSLLGLVRPDCPNGRCHVKPFWRLERSRRPGA